MIIRVTWNSSITNKSTGCPRPENLLPKQPSFCFSKDCIRHSQMVRNCICNIANTHWPISFWSCSWHREVCIVPIRTQSCIGSGGFCMMSAVRYTGIMKRALRPANPPVSCCCFYCCCLLQVTDNAMLTKPIVLASMYRQC